MKKCKFDKYLLLTIIFTIIGFGIIFAISNIYPFGSDIIGLVDFDSGYIPVYYKLWDVLHFKTTALFDWNLGGGLNAFGSLIGNGFISPLCWIIALFPRSSIPYTLSYVFLIKLVFISLMTYIAIGKIMTNTKGQLKMFFTLLYTFSAFIFMMSTNLLYLDSIAIFPLLVYSLKELLEKGKWKLYTILLTLTLLMSYYIAWLDLLFIIGTSGLYLLLMKTDNKKEKAVKVLLCTLSSLLMSCVLFLPGFMFAKTSARMASNFSNDTIFSYFKEKWIYLFTSAIPFVLTIKQLFVKKDRKINWFFLAMVLMLFLGAVFEPINALWHTGSHSGFPFRYGYQLNLVTILISLYYLNNNYKEVKKTNNIRLMVPIFLIINILAIFFITREKIYVSNLFASGDIVSSCFYILLFVFILYIVTFIFILRNSTKKAFILSTVLLVIESITFGYLYMQNIPYRTSIVMEEVKEKFNLVNDGYNYSLYLTNDNVNFPYIMEVPSIENRIHFIQTEEINQRDYLGFGGEDTIVLSKGGNLFTNAIMMNKYYLTEKEMNSNYYELIDSKEDYYYYKAKYNLSYLIPYNGKTYNEEEANLFINTNQIYKTLFNGTNNIYNDATTKSNDGVFTINTKKGKTYNGLVTFDADELNEYTKKYGDFNVSFEYDEKQVSNYNEVSVNDTTLLVSFDSNTEEVVLKLKELNIDASFYEFNEEEFKNFINKYGNLNVSVSTSGTSKIYNFESENDTSILLPINCTDNYEVSVNDKKVEYSCNLYNMLSINVKKGTNKIVITYNQKWFNLGIKISIISLIVFLVGAFAGTKLNLIHKKFIVWPLFIVSFVAFLFFVIKIYILSFI